MNDTHFDFDEGQNGFNMMDSKSLLLLLLEKLDSRSEEFDFKRL